MGAMGARSLALHSGIEVKSDEGTVTFAYSDDSAKAMAGTTRSLVSNMVKGETEGWEKKLVLNGVGYRAKATGNTVNLTIGLSHPVDYELPEGLSAEPPSQTEIVIMGSFLVGPR